VPPPPDPARSPPFASFDEAFAWLSSRTNYETMATVRYDARTYGLDRVRRLLERAGRPDRGRDVVQVVGSKGKGSVAAMLSSILTASGRRTGLFSSPHLVSPRERIRVDGTEVDDDHVTAALGRLRDHVEGAARRGEPCTFFEIHTVAALLAMEAAGCDAVVLEAGMGGRLDATTAADARAVAVTSLSLDHTLQLGTTVASVAEEKAAAVREGFPCVCGVRPGVAGFDVIDRVCRERASPLLALGRDIELADVETSLDAATGRARTAARVRVGDDELEVEVPLLGAHQAENAAVAAALALATPWSGPAPSPADVVTGLAATRLRARLQALGTAPLVLIDGAHSPASFSALADAVGTAVHVAPRVFVVGMAGDKDVEGAVARLRGVADHVVATTSGAVRAAPPDRIADAARTAGLAASTAPTHGDALDDARSRAGAGGAVVVTGSLYLCGAVLADDRAA
jgi:folylpolyglutamate synthase/dihydrofolate synthase